MNARSEILVAEDDAFILEYASTLLQASGYGVTGATRGLEALEMLAAGMKADLLLTDVHMSGGMDGVELAQQARLILPDLKILYTSGYSVDTEHDRLFPDAGFLPKPYRRRTFIEMVERMLAQP